MRPALAWILAAALVGAALLPSSEARAGTFLFTSELDSDIVTHPLGYYGSGGVLSIDLCVDPTSSNASAMEVAVQNIVNAYRRLTPVNGNLSENGDNDLASNEMDFESAALHELGHCLGLYHPNMASESGLTGGDTEYTKAHNGSNNAYDLDDGTDDVEGSGDDGRSDDGNLFFFRKSNNDPFSLEASTFDSTTYGQSLGDLPGGDTFPANGDRDVAALLGVTGTESVMQQGQGYDEAQRELSHDDIATLRFGMSGFDEIQGNSDDYSIELSYVGQTTSCDIVVDFDNSQTAFATCRVSGAYIQPAFQSHVRVTSAAMYFNDSYNWYFTSDLAYCGNGELDDGEDCDDGDTDSGDGCDDFCGIEVGWTCYGEPSVCYLGTCGDTVVDTGEQCDDGGTLPGDCCSEFCQYELAGGSCDEGDICSEADTCDGAGICVAGTPAVCDDGQWCNGVESCVSFVGCQAGEPPVVDDGIACTDDSCDEVNDTTLHVPNHGLCSDLLFCNGAEVCNPSLGCEAGTPITVDDGVVCTDDSCDEVGDVVVNTPNDTYCDDSLFCNGDEVCDVLEDCQSGTPPVVDDGITCSMDSCDEVNDVVLHVANDAFCDDDSVCTNDICDLQSGCYSEVVDECLLIPATNRWWQATLACLLVLSAASFLVRRGGQPARPQ